MPNYKLPSNGKKMKAKTPRKGIVTMPVVRQPRMPKVVSKKMK